MQDQFNLAHRKVNKMKTTLIFLTISISLFTNAQAKQFELSKPDDNYISLNECLYALSKGTRLSTGKGEVFIYQNQVWEMSFNDDQKYKCTLIGKLAE
ncbi:hypothetical protein N9F22_04820 [Alphaproteobacteria bacterium]|nr:hypothetical protein [Alphaproteobacteria bacterium]